MALQQCRLGTLTNILQWDDVDYDSAIETDQPIKAGAPVDPNDVVILGGPGAINPVAVVDIDDPSTELNLLEGVIGSVLLVYEVEVTSDQYTIYAFDASDTDGENVPFSVDAATSGLWIAIAGKYTDVERVVGSGSSTDHAVVRWDGVTGRLVQDSVVIVSDIGQIGINTVPSYALHVVEASSPTVFLQDSTTPCQTFLQAANTIGRVGTFSNHEFNIVTNNVDRVQITNGGVVNIGDGGATNYSSFAVDGLLTMAGTARVIQHTSAGAIAWHPGVGAPTPDDLSVFHVLVFDVDDEAHFNFLVPHRMVTGSVINVVVCFTHQDAVDVGTAEWELEYNCVGEGENVTGATTTISAISGATALHEHIDVTLVTGITGAAAHDIIGMILRHTNGGTIGVDVDLIEVHFEVLVDKLGEAT
jgi:hypothetical protein